MKNKLWLVFILITIVTWGIWGAFSDTQMDRDGIPETVVYILWALTMIPCAIAALVINKGKFMHDWKSAVLGCTVGLLGAGGQLVLFKALALGPAYIIFPFIAMSPVIVITLASIFLKEKANKWQIAGICMALVAILLLSLQSGSSKKEYMVTVKEGVAEEELRNSINTAFDVVAGEDAEFDLKVKHVEGAKFQVITDFAPADTVKDKKALEEYIFVGCLPLMDDQGMTFDQFKIEEVQKSSSGILWIILAVLVLLAWGIQGFFMKFANNSMDAESIFIWMAISGLVLIPIAWFMNGDASLFFHGGGVATKSLTCFGIQILNSIGALTLVYAYRHGKAVIVSPMEGLSPLVTVLLSLVILSVIPTPLQIAGICCAAFAMYALSK